MKTVFKYIWQYFRKLDKLLFITVAALSVFSLVLLYSIVVNGAATISVSSSLYKTQAAAVIAGWIAALILSAVDYNKIIKLWVIYAPLAIILSMLVFTGMGIEVSGNRAWLDLGFMTLQPSELLKVAFITTFALHLSNKQVLQCSPAVRTCLHTHSAGNFAGRRRNSLRFCHDIRDNDVFRRHLMEIYPALHCGSALCPVVRVGKGDAALSENALSCSFR